MTFARNAKYRHQLPENGIDRDVFIVFVDDDPVTEWVIGEAVHAVLVQDAGDRQAFWWARETELSGH